MAILPSICNSTVAPNFIGIIFIIVFAIVIIKVFRGAKQWKENKNSPRLSVSVIIKSKRTKVTRYNHHHDHNHNMYSSNTSTTYFITFEFERGDQSEFRVSDKEFGVLTEGDIGTLTFQGTRYLDFTRSKT